MSTSRIDFTFRPIDRWPQEPTRYRRRAQFRVLYSKALDLLNTELAKLGVRRAYLQVDVTERELRNDGQIRANVRPRTPRVIVSAQTRHGPISLPCDTYDNWQHNLYAIALSLEALRAVDRYGVTKRGEQYRGLKQITAGDGPINSQEAVAFFQRVLGAAISITSIGDVEAAYRAASKSLHPDVTGDSTSKDWLALQRAVIILRDYFGTGTTAAG